MNIEVLKGNFFEEVNEVEDTILKKIDFLKEEDRMDEANLEKIKLNVIGIFKKMFDVSLRKVFKHENNTDESVKYDNFKKVYLDFYNNIPSNWYINLEKAKKNNDFDNVLIEEIKINTMYKLKECFEKCLEE